MQPPLQLTMAPHVTFASAVSLQLPEHVPSHVAWHLPVQCASALRAEHLPSHVPAHAAIPPAGVATPSHFPSQVPEQPPPVIVPLHAPLQVPVQSASHVPLH